MVLFLITVKQKCLFAIEFFKRRIMTKVSFFLFGNCYGGFIVFYYFIYFIYFLFCFSFFFC